MFLLPAIVILLLAGFLLFKYNVLPQKVPAKQSSSETLQEHLDVDCLKPNIKFDIRNTQPRPYRPWRSGKFVLTMGIRKMPREDWLLLDNRYFVEQKMRKALLETNRSAVFQALPGSESACKEVLEEVVAFFSRRYPQWFYHPTGKPDHIHNALTGRTFKVAEPFDTHPLEVAAQLAMEDINLLIQGSGPDPEQFYILASYTAAPAGWHLEDRIGWSLMDLHKPVPGWKDKLRGPVESFLRRMKADAPAERNNYFLQDSDELFVNEPFATTFDKPTAEKIRLRYERQTFQRLPKSNAIAFLVRTYITPLTDLQDEPESLKELLGAMKALPEDMASYKARHIWGDVVEAYCKEKLQEHGLSEEAKAPERMEKGQKEVNEKVLGAGISVKVQEVVSED